MGKFRIELSDGTEHIIDDIVAITPVEGDNDESNDTKRDSQETNAGPGDDI